VNNCLIFPIGAIVFFSNLSVKSPVKPEQWSGAQWGSRTSSVKWTWSRRETEMKLEWSWSEVDRCVVRGTAACPVVAESNSHRRRYGLTLVLLLPTVRLFVPYRELFFCELRVRFCRVFFECCKIRLLPDHKSVFVFICLTVWMLETLVGRFR